MNLKSKVLLYKYRQLEKAYHTTAAGYVDSENAHDLNYAQRALPKLAEGEKILTELLEKGAPFAIGRLGETECRTTVLGIMEHFPVKERNKAKLQEQSWNWCEGAGFFPNDVNYLPKFAGTITDALGGLDYVAPLWFSAEEEYLIEKYAKAAKLIRMTSVDSFPRSDTPWTAALAGKKVLVVSPFAKTIERQYQNRERIYPDKPVLPEFELITFKAVQTQAKEADDRFKDWFEALEWMKAEIRKIDFDVALLGCGAYGLPLAADIKSSGRSAIHTCGQTQLLFGIKGSRWNDDAEVVSNYNSAWTYPSMEETPKRIDSFEGGYWK